MSGRVPFSRRQRRFIDAPQDVRCRMTITLSDGSGAQCGRRQCTGSVYCTQHARKLVRDAQRGLHP